MLRSRAFSRDDTHNQRAPMGGRVFAEFVACRAVVMGYTQPQSLEAVVGDISPSN